MANMLPPGIERHALTVRLLTCELSALRSLIHVDEPQYIDAILGLMQELPPHSRCGSTASSPPTPTDPS